MQVFSIHTLNIIKLRTMLKKEKWVSMSTWIWTHKYIAVQISNSRKLLVSELFKGELQRSWFIKIKQSPLLKAGFTHANFVGRFLKCSKQSQAKNHFNATTSPILKNLWTAYRFGPIFAWILLEIFEDIKSADKTGVCKSGLIRIKNHPL